MDIIEKKNIFIEKSNKKHNKKYDYSKVEYIDSTTKVCIICPEHGEFWQTPQAHVRGNSCPLCSNKKRGDTFRLDKESFIKRAKELHNNIYDYSKVEYINSNTKVCVICPEHGEFYMTPSNHLLGQKCPKCKGKGLSIEEIIKKANIIHDNKYDYSKVIFTKMHDKVKIICPIHGEFEQSLSKHISKKQGCPKCSAINRGKENLYSQEFFIKKAKEIHGDKYDYSNTVYNGMNHMIKYICSKHGEIEQRAFDHLRGFGCYKCVNLESKPEIEIYNFLKEKINDEIIRNDRKILNGQELDILIPSKNIAIEYNGLRWHSELFGKDKWYHYEKTKKCNELNIKLIQIFEDEYINKKEIVLNKLKHILGLNNDLPKIMGRKCKVEIINKEVAESFLNDFHIQGYVKSTIHFGAVFKNKLISVMSFTKIDKKLNKWELTRFASDHNYVCQGVGGKLFNNFIKLYNPTEVKTFADKRWTLNKENNFYLKLGFKLDKELNPDYEYICNSNPSLRIHKFNFRKKNINKKYGLPLTMTETEMTTELGYSKIWNCGLYKFLWVEKEKNINILKSKLSH